MVRKIRKGDKVHYNNLVCLVVDVEHSGNKDYLELQPCGSSARFNVDSSQVTRLMNEGTTERHVGEQPLYD